MPTAGTWGRSQEYLQGQWRDRDDAGTTAGGRYGHLADARLVEGRYAASYRAGVEEPCRLVSHRARARLHRCLRFLHSLETHGQSLAGWKGREALLPDRVRRAVLRRCRGSCGTMTGTRLAGSTRHGTPTRVGQTSSAACSLKHGIGPADCLDESGRHYPGRRELGVLGQSSPAGLCQVMIGVERPDEAGAERPEQARCSPDVAARAFEILRTKYLSVLTMDPSSSASGRRPIDPLPSWPSTRTSLGWTTVSYPADAEPGDAGLRGRPGT